MIEDIKRPRKSLREVLPRQPKGNQIHNVYKEVGPAAMPVPRPRSRGLSIFLAIVAGIIIAAMFFFVSGLFAEATVTIETKQKEISVQEAIEALKTPLPSIGSNESTQLTFDVMLMPAVSESETIPANGVEKVEEVARGQITITNNFSSAPQKLIASTRFEDSAGRIYRIREPITVPGMGSVDATVYADESGESYNQSGIVTFTIPGFKGDPRYTKFSAKSKTAIAGGFSGERGVVPAEVLASVRGNLLDRVAARLKDSARFQLPDEFILYDDAIFIKVLEEKQTPTEDGNSVELAISASLEGIILNRVALSRRLVASGLPDFEQLDYVISNLDDLRFSLPGRETLDPATVEKISFNLGGDAVVRAIVDEAELRQKLAGQTRQEANKVFSQLPAIDNAIMNFKLPWQRRFPGSAERIIIKS